MSICGSLLLRVPAFRSGGLFGSGYAGLWQSVFEIVEVLFAGNGNHHRPLDTRQFTGAGIGHHCYRELLASAGGYARVVQNKAALAAMKGTRDSLNGYVNC